MSTESVLTSVPISSLKDAAVTTSTIEAPKRKDLDTIPPCFFVGPHETEKTVTFEPEFTHDSGSIAGNADRRLSGILAEPTEASKKEEVALERPSQRIKLDTADANRGVFGIKKPKVANHNVDNVAENISSSSSGTTPFVNSLEPSKTVRVFGYPSNLLHNIIEHFMTYGNIVEYRESPGNWVSITYESSTSALAALKSNGIIISKTYMIGVSMEENSPSTVTHDIIPLDSNERVFKNAHGLGNGKVGLSVADKNNTLHTSNKITSGGGIMSKLNDTFFGW
ncbi:hypothetical protein BD770DRAFT_448535 [Pilaira anomala]|nr:hypothetical protein BD770DRAFT_448535 [Pilaira anomala]